MREKSRIEVATIIFDRLPSLVDKALRAIIEGKDEHLSPKEAVDALRVAISFLQALDPIMEIISSPNKFMGDADILNFVAEKLEEGDGNTL